MLSKMLELDMQKKPTENIGIESGQRSSQPLSPFKKVYLAVTMLVVATLLILLKPFADPSDDYVRQQQARDIAGGKSEFKIYKNHVYVLIPSGGDYLVPQADIHSIHLLAKGYSARHIAADKNHVYCGNRVLPKLKPAKTYFMGAGYLSDDSTHYYCSPSSQPNPDISPVVETLKIIGFQLGLNQKPQSYIYPFYELAPSISGYQLSSPEVVSDGRTTYDRGILIPDVKPQQLYYLPEFTTEQARIRTSERYQADGQHVYYGHDKLPIKDSGRLSSFRWDAGTDQLFLYDPDQQLFYYRDQPFPSDYAPYQLLMRTSDHASDPLFLTPSGIYFFNPKDMQLQKAGENPFKQRFVRLAPDVFHNGQDLFYLSTGKWKYKRVKRGIRICSNATVLRRIANTPLTEWKKIGDVTYGSLKWKMGSVWQHQATGNKQGAYYYFDEFGQGQSIVHSIYQINDETTLKQVLISKETSDSMRQLIYNHMTPLKSGEPFAVAEVKTGDCWVDWLSKTGH